jgi:hypothetical protein
VPAASVSLFRKPNFFNDACHSAAAHGFYQPKTSPLQILNTDMTIAAGLYVVLYGVLYGGHLPTPTEGPQETSYKPRPPACGAARDATADNYGRKLKPTAKKTRKTRQKTKKTLKNTRKKKACKNSK